MKIRELPWLPGHQLQGKTVFPAAGYISTMLEASRSLAPDGNAISLIDVQDFTIHQAMPFDEEDAGIETLVSLTDIRHDEPRQVVTARFTYSAAVGKDAETLSLVASGGVEVHLGEASSKILPPQGPSPSNLISISEDRFYASMEELGYGYSGPFRALSSMKRKLGRAECRVTITSPEDEVNSEKLLVHPAMLDCAIQAVIVAYCHPGDGGLWSLHVPTTFNRIRVNPSLCGSAWGETGSVPVSAATFKGSGIGLLGDVDIYGSNTPHAAIQVQGVKAVPFAAATAADDEKLFARFHWASISPDGDDIAKDDRVTPEQHQLALATERTAFYYMRKFDRELPADHPARSDPTFASYLNFGRHMISLADAGRHKYAKKEWVNDTLEVLQEATAQYSSTIDVRIIRGVGEAMPRVFEGETTILEHLLPTGLLTDYYVNALGMRQSSGWIGRAVKQIVHRYPRMNILEIGAGTGGATKSIFKQIGHDFESYTFTDVSTGFFQEAESVFAPYKKRMVFRALDAGGDPVAQGFAPGSYDLIVASFVIHATNKLEGTMRNVRKLLRPGGFVVLGEGTNQNWLRDGFVFGTLPGWWAGADEGRNLSPCVPPEKWDDVLRETGFSGIDTITPDGFMNTYATSVFVAQAVDEKVDFLREPLSAPIPSSIVSRKDTIEDLVVIGGSTLRTSRLVADLKRILNSFTNKALYFKSLADVQHHKFAPGSTVLSLTELDKPVFGDTVPEDFEGLKQLVAAEKTLLWVTAGRRIEDPYANMSLGFLRNGTCENRELRLQSMDFEGSKPDARVLAEALLRLEYASEVMASNGQTDLLWSIEPEIIVNSVGRQLVPRLAPMADANDRYNSGRRKVTHEVNSNETAVTIHTDEKQHYSMQDVSLYQQQSTSEPGLHLHASHATLSPIMTPLGPRFLIFGSTSKSNKKLLTLTTSLTSINLIPEGASVECGDSWATPPERLVALTAANISAISILESLVSGQKLLAHNSPMILAEVLSRRAKEKGVEVLFTTDSMDANNDSWISIPTYMTTRQIQEVIPDGVSAFVSFGSAPCNSALLSCLPSYCRTEVLGTTFPDKTDLGGNTSTSSAVLAEVLSRAIRHVEDDDVDLVRNPELVIPVATPSDVTAGKIPHESMSVIQWSENSIVQAQVNRLDAKQLFSSGKTYWLVGLSRSLGLSICDWMIHRGAKYIVITSRNPQVEPSWEEAHRRKGVTIKIIAK